MNINMKLKFKLEQQNVKNVIKISLIENVMATRIEFCIRQYFIENWNTFGLIYHKFIEMQMNNDKLDRFYAQLTHWILNFSK